MVGENVLDYFLDLKNKYYYFGHGGWRAGLAGG